MSRVLKSFFLTEKLADMYMLTSDYEEASRRYTEALQFIDKSDSGEQYYLARSGTRIEETPNEKNVRRAFLLTKRGECAERMGKDFKVFERDYLAAIELHPDSAATYLR